MNVDKLYDQLLEAAIDALKTGQTGAAIDIIQGMNAIKDLKENTWTKSNSPN